MNDIEKVKRHLGRPIPIKLTNEDGAEDVFYFKPLNVEQQAILVEISDKIKESGSKKVKKIDDGKEIEIEVPNIDKETTNEMFDLILDVCRKSLTGLDEETLKEFTNSNFNQLAANLNNLIGGSSKKELDLIQKAREARSGQQE